MSESSAKEAMRRLAAKAAEVYADETKTVAQKSTELDAIEAELKAASNEVRLGQLGRMLGLGGNSARFNGDAMTILADGGRKSLAPPLLPSADQLAEMHEAVVGRKSFKVEVKTTTDVSSMLPPAVIPGIVEMRHEPTRVLDFIPSAGISSPTWEYFRHTSTTGAPATVAPGGAKPEVSLTVDTVTGTARKIAAHTAVEDETLQDFAGFASYVSNELVRMYTDVENAQLLNGDGTGTNIEGLLTQTGILTRDYTTDHTADSTATGLDTLEMAMTDLRTGSAFATADLVVLHPTTWSKLRRTKDTYGNYILGNPSETDGRTLWGIPVIQTTSIAAGTGLVAELQLAGEARIRQGITLESTPYNGDDWTSNLTRFRVEARLGLGVVRPAAICKVTSL